MKGNAIARIIIYSLLALLLISILFVAIAADGFMFQIGSGGTVVESEGHVDAADVKCIQIDWASGSVAINIADTDKITFQETAPENSKYQMTYDISGDTLKLSYGQPSISFGISSIPNKDLVITVPRDWVCEELEFDGASLTIGIHYLTVEKIDLDGASNSLEFIGSVKYVEIDGASNQIRLECTNRPTLIDVDGASCDLELTLPKNCGFLVQMDGLSCDFSSELDYTTSDGDYFYGDRQCKVNVDGVSCDVTISESAECSHVWDKGQEMTIPGDIEKEMIYTCTICGEIKSEPIPHSKHTWDSGTSLGNSSIVYTCTQCGDTKTVTAEAERHGFIWLDSFTRGLLEDQIFEPGYYAGAEIVFTTEIFTEFKLELYCDGVFVCGPTVVGDHWEFYYTMPDHIVYIELRQVAN